MFNWFVNSFHRECEGDYTDMKIVAIDFYADYPGRREAFSAVSKAPLTHIPPMPNVFCGPHRLTQSNYWAVPVFRNTALCVAPDGYIVYVDDLTVLLSGWLAEVRNAMKEGYIACGTYQKVIGLEVDDEGRVRGYLDFPPGHDTRCKQVFTTDPTPCSGGWQYGNVALPVEALLTVNGYDHRASVISGEDYICGLMLEKHGYKHKFCPRMATFESEERHHLPGENFKRIIKPGTPASNNYDASHVILRRVQSGEWSKADAQPDMRALREAVLIRNEPFPIPTEPTTDWFDGQKLSEFV